MLTGIDMVLAIFVGGTMTNLIGRGLVFLFIISCLARGQNTDLIGSLGLSNSSSVDLASSAPYLTFTNGPSILPAAGAGIPYVSYRDYGTAGSGMTTMSYDCSQ
jgi:hypothetical protein